MKNTSTPKVVLIKSRRALHDKLPINTDLSLNDCSEIPIETMNKSPRLSQSPRNARRDSLSKSEPPEEQSESGSENESDSQDSYSEDEEGINQLKIPVTVKPPSPRPPIEKQTVADEGEDTQWNVVLVVGLALVMVVIACALLVPSNEVPLELEQLQQIMKKYPSQTSDLWVALESGVNDVRQFNHPVSYIFLYKKGSDKTVERLLGDISKYVLCNISSCNNRAIILEENELNSPEVLEDFGILIEKFKIPLEENGLMIIKNLDKVPGKAAGVFHSLCDQVSPLVERSLFIFTMKVDEFHGDQNVNHLEVKLRNQWNDLKIDHFYPLFTRISSMILEIVP